MRTEPSSANQFPQTPLSLNTISQVVLVLATQDWDIFIKFSLHNNVYLEIIYSQVRMVTQH